MGRVVDCAIYEGGRRLGSLDIDDPDQMKVQPGRVIWIGLYEPGQEVLAKLQRYFGLHELAVEDARHGHQRPKVEEYGETLFAVIQLLELSGDELEVGEVDIFIGANFVLSVRNRSRQDFLGVRGRCEREPHLLRHGAGFVFYALMDAVVDRYFPIVDSLESELEVIEERIFAKGTARSNIERLYALKSKVMTLKHAVAPLLEVAGKLSSGRVPEVCVSTREYFRDVADHLHRINASVDTIRDTIGTAIQVNLSMVTIEESEVNKRLAAWAGIFAVATAFAGIWGMNFEAMPELHWRYGYPAALSVIAVACGILYRRFKKAGWL